MSEKVSISDVRKRSWETRRKKYGARGHGGAYGTFRPVYTAPWHDRLQTMQNALIWLYRGGVLSEGQVSKMTGLDRVSCRELAIQQGSPAPSHAGPCGPESGCDGNCVDIANSKPQDKKAVK